MKWIVLIIGVVFLALMSTLVVRFLTMKHVPDDVSWSIESSVSTGVEVNGQTGGKLLMVVGGRVVEIGTDGNVSWEMKVSGGVGVVGCWRTGPIGEYVGFWVPGKGVWVVARDGKEVWHYDDPKLETVRGWDDPTMVVIGDSDGTIYKRTMRGDTPRIWNGVDGPREKLSEGDVALMGDPWISGVDWSGNDFVGDFFFCMKRFGLIGKVDVNNSLAWSWGGLMLCQPSSIDVLSGGNILICDSGNHRIVEVNSVGNVVWSYDTGERMPVAAERLWTGVTLVTYLDGAAALNPNSFEMWSVNADEVLCAKWYG